VSFYQFVLPALEKMLGMIDKPLVPIFKAQALQHLRKRAGRTEVQRGILVQDTDGDWMVKSTGQQGSGVLHSMSLANAFIILEHDRGEVKAGEYVNVQPFSSLF
ncbi:MAG: molybdopterin molybdenumtransferase MoeA, partial [Methylococcaceae bacterium]|nr:molybdopterin molybdenumtransferase MoeA [Methylococcaceae bacterium]